MISLLGIICYELERSWKNIRNFAFNNRTMFEILFIILYALLQVALILFVEIYPTKISFILSIFAILVLSIFALHKLLMESRIKLLENRVAEMTLEKQEIISVANAIYDEYRTVESETKEKSKSLNKREKSE